MIARFLITGLLAIGVAGFAQQGPPRFRGGMGGARFLGAEAGMPGRVVKNSPFSAEVVTETTQALADGNRIHQTFTSRLYRDSEGRTRREQALNSLSGLAPNSSLPPVVFINDPVSGSNYALNPSDHTATRSASMRPGSNSRGTGSGSATMRPRMARQNNPNVKTDDLGTQIIEGLQANGKRTTFTIPPGQIGNDQPLQIVTESWYSPDLQTVILSKRTDPRSGETVRRYTNISRVEPPIALFQVPADYKVTDAPRFRMGPPRN